MNRKFVFIIRLLIVVVLILNLNTSNILKAQNQSRVVQVTDQDGKQILLYQESHALLIWISEYDNSAWTKLDAVEKGAKKLKRALEKDGFNVIVKGNLTTNEFKQTIDNFIGKYGYDKNNRLVIFFAGHGHTIEGDDGGKGSGRGRRRYVIDPVKI